MSWLERLKEILHLGKLEMPEEVTQVVTPYNFFEDFNEEKLKKIKVLVDRGGFKGIGDFGDVLKRVQKVQKAAASILRGKRSSSSVKKKGEDVPYLMAEFDKLIREAGEWLDHVSTKSKDTEDKLRSAKIGICERLIDGARWTQEQLLALSLVENKQWDVETFRGKVREREAQSIWSSGERSKASAGTSEIHLLQDPGGKKTRYAFKPAKGESEMMLMKMGMEPGGGTMREALTSVVCEELFRQTGLKTGFPVTTLAKLDGQTGALIEGLNGDFIDAETMTESRFPDEQKKIAKITPKELQKSVLANLVVCQIGDIKYDNLVVMPDNTTRPFDAGTAFPTKEWMEKQLKYDDNPMLGRALSKPGCQLSGVSTPNEPMDKELIEQILKIDEKKILEAASKARDRMSEVDPMFDPKKLDDTSLEYSVLSIRAMKNVLGGEKTLTLAEFFPAYWTEFRKLALNL